MYEINVEPNLVIASNGAENRNKMFNIIKPNLNYVYCEDWFNSCFSYLIKIYQSLGEKSSSTELKETNFHT